MNERPIPLVAALSGLASVVLLFVGQGIGGGGSSPDPTKSRAEHLAWLTKQHASTRGYAGVYLELLGILLMIVFAATLWSVLRKGDETGIFAATAFGAGLTSAAVKLARHMTETDFEGVDDTVKDGIGEICNMLAGAWKGKVPDLAANCGLSVPAVIAGRDYNLHVQAPGFQLHHAYCFDDSHFDVTIICDGLK